MIRLPIETMDRKRRGSAAWSAGKVSVEQGTLTDAEAEGVRTTLHAVHRMQSDDADVREAPDPDEMLRGPGESAEAFLFHAGFLPAEAGCLVLYEEASGDEIDLVLLR